MIYRDFDFVTVDDMVRAGATVGVALVLVVVGLIGVVALLSRTGVRGGLVLQARLGDGATVTERSQRGWLQWFEGHEQQGSGQRRGGAEVPPEPTVLDAPPVPPTDVGRSLTGAAGTALSDLRPSGVATIDGERVDVVTEGEYLRSGEEIEVIRDDGYRRVVRRRV